MKPYADHIEKYRGYDIVFRYFSNNAKTYRIQINGESITAMAFISARACKNVIDTHLNKQKNDPPNRS